MIRLQLSTSAVGETCFGFSPLAEVAASLRLLGAPQPGHVHAPWLRTVRPALADVDLELLHAIAPPGRWATRFLFPQTSSTLVTIEDQLNDLGRVPVDRIACDLELAWSDRDMPRRLRSLLDSGAGAPERIAEELWSYWDVALAPYWSRMCGVLEDDVAFRASLATDSGLYALFSDLHGEISVEGDELQIAKPWHDDRAFSGAVLRLVPSVFVWPGLILSHEEPSTFGLVYAARGAARVWESLPTAEPTENPLHSLMGRTRARILEMVSVPMSTTEVARALGQSAGTVNRHLSVLRDSGMVVSWRSGRSVLYRQSALGTSLAGVTAERAGRG